MQSRTRRDRRTAATEALAMDDELNILRDVFRLLPTGVTVQDEHGRFLLVNDAAAVQLGIAVGGPAAGPSAPLYPRPDSWTGVVPFRRPAVIAECAHHSPVKHVFPPARRPGRV